MIGKVHRFGGLCVGLATSYYLLGDKSDVITLMAGTMLGSAGALLPDIDNKDSIVSRQFPKLSGCVRKLTAHRQFTHSLINCNFLLLYTETMPGYIYPMFVFFSRLFDAFNTRFFHEGRDSMALSD